MNDADEPLKPTVHAVKSGPGMMPIIMVAIVILAAVGGIFTYNEFLKPEPYSVIASIVVDFGNGTVLSDDVGFSNNTPLGMLREFVGVDNVVATEAGYIVTIIGVTTVDDVAGLEGTEARYWMYYVNGEMPMESAALLVIEDNDLVEFRFETSPW